MGSYLGFLLAVVTQALVTDKAQGPALGAGGIAVLDGVPFGAQGGGKGITVKVVLDVGDLDRIGQRQRLGVDSRPADDPDGGAVPGCFGQCLGQAVGRDGSGGLPRGVARDDDVGAPGQGRKRSGRLSQVVRPMTTAQPWVRWRKCARSSGRCQGMVPSLPITALAAWA